MKSHPLHLNSAPFGKIKAGRKTIESRLNDEKRREYKIGDTLIFTCRDTGEVLTATITQLHYFPTFLELFESVPKEKYANESPELLLQEIEQFYSQPEQQHWGVIGIEFNLL